MEGQVGRGRHCPWHIPRRDGAPQPQDRQAIRPEGESPGRQQREGTANALRRGRDLGRRLADHRSASKSPTAPRPIRAEVTFGLRLPALSSMLAPPDSTPGAHMTADGHFKVPTPVNEPTRAYAPGDPHRKSLKARLAPLTDPPPHAPLPHGRTRLCAASTTNIH